MTDRDPPSDGWEPETPVSDGVMRAYVLNYADQMAAMAESVGGRVIRTDRYLIADYGRPSGIFNSAVLLRPAPADLPRIADEIAAQVDDAGTGSVHLWSPWPTVDLTPQGWNLGNHLPFEIRPPGGPIPEARPDVRIERVTDRERLRDWERVVVEGFPFPEMQPHAPGSLIGDSVLEDPRMRLWLAYDGDQPAAAAALFVAHGIAGFALGATLPTARRKGLWYGLVRARLLEEPELIAGSVFSRYSRPGAEKIGFLPITRWTLWWRPRGKETR